MGLRIALFFSAATVAGAFSESLILDRVPAVNISMLLGGLLAAAIANMDGIGGKAGTSALSLTFPVIY